MPISTKYLLSPNTAEYISNALGFIAPKDGIVLTGSSTVIIGG